MSKLFVKRYWKFVARRDDVPFLVANIAADIYVTQIQIFFNVFSDGKVDSNCIWESI